MWPYLGREMYLASKEIGEDIDSYWLDRHKGKISKRDSYPCPIGRPQTEEARRQHVVG
jgi:hypothetical protein